MNALPHQRFQNGSGHDRSRATPGLAAQRSAYQRSSTIYPPLCEQLADLLGRLRANDDRIEHMNANALPRVCRPLLVAEQVARGLDGFVQSPVNVPRIVRRVQLPTFQYDIHAPYAWPRSLSVDTVNLMFRSISELGSRSA
jgi:hypothetical protein